MVKTPHTELDFLGLVECHFDLFAPLDNIDVRAETRRDFRAGLRKSQMILLRFTYREELTESRFYVRSLKV
uniref:Uncharacterized protein n=1 Tax=Hyaloperonospora arabidopsidis (strain Emoy2) TaxID=559515 RepID=M4BZD6_HYAAE